MKRSIGYLVVISLLLTTSYSCSETDLEDDAPSSSFGLIQQKILNVSCALSGCHASENDMSFAQHNLVLSKNVAYANLINTEPENEHARHDGLKRVVPGNTEASLLLHKLHCNDHHTSDYGNQMPLGMNPLSKGQIEFITQWIEEGASEEGIIQADTSLLNDMTSDCEETFVPLEVPASGYQLSVEPFDVAPNFEREIFVYKEVGNEEEIYVNKIEMKMRRNSHHFLVNTISDEAPDNRVPSVNVIRDLRDANNNYITSTLAQMEFQVPTIASQTPQLEFNFPPGVALKMPAHHKLDVNLHYVNKTTKTFQGECYINLHTTDAVQVEHEARSLFLNAEDIYLPPYQKTILTRSFEVEAPIKIFMLTSHTHKLAERFEIHLSGNGRINETIYASSNWHHPEIKIFDEPLELVTGDVLKIYVTYNNTSSKTVRFGLTSEDEMAIVYGYYF